VQFHKSTLFSHPYNQASNDKADPVPNKLTDGTAKYFKTHLSLDINALNEESYIKLPAGGSIERTFDFTDTHALSVTGTIQIQSTGGITYAPDNSTQPVGSLYYESNVLDLELTEEDKNRSQKAFAAKAERAIPDKESCGEEEMEALKEAHQKCAKQARWAAESAEQGIDGKMQVLLPYH
jgi:Deuterolysin metalloprotease (M35) family